MSNARSPREVCSTTIGTSGLIVLASFASSGGFLPNVATARAWPARHPASPVRAALESSGARLDSSRPRPRRSSVPGRPELAGTLLGAFLAGRPKLVASLRLLDADLVGLPHEQLERLAVGDLLAHLLHPIRLAQLLE